MEHANINEPEEALKEPIEEEKPDEPKDEKSEEKVEEQPVKSEYSKFIVILCFINIIAFTAVCLVYLWFGKPLNDTLIVLFFGCFGLEFASLAFIKGRKIRYSDGNAGNKKMPSVTFEINSNDKEGK